MGRSSKSSKLTGGRPSGSTRPHINVAALGISTCPCLRFFAHKHDNKMLSNAVEALYIFDQHKSVFLLFPSFLPLNTDLYAVNQSWNMFTA